VGLDAPTADGAGRGGLDRFGQLTGVDDTGDAQRTPEGVSPLRQCETSRIDMQMCAPTRPPMCRIGHGTELARRTLDRDDSQQLGDYRALTATDAGADRLSRQHRII
jgi:hypothetical protein